MTMERPKWLDAMEVAATKALDDILKEIDEDNGPSMADIAESVTELDEEKMEKQCEQPYKLFCKNCSNKFDY